MYWHETPIQWLEALENITCRRKKGAQILIKLNNIKIRYGIMRIYQWRSMANLRVIKSNTPRLSASTIDKIEKDIIADHEPYIPGMYFINVHNCTCPARRGRGTEPCPKPRDASPSSTTCSSPWRPRPNPLGWNTTTRPTRTPMQNKPQKPKNLLQKLPGGIRNYIFYYPTCNAIVTKIDHGNIVHTSYTKKIYGNCLAKQLHFI